MKGLGGKASNRVPVLLLDMVIVLVSVMFPQACTHDVHMMKHVTLLICAVFHANHTSIKTRVLALPLARSHVPAILCYQVPRPRM